MTPSHAPHAPTLVQPLLAPHDRARAVDVPSLRQCTRDLLAAHVPLSLLLDLADPRIPDSAGVYAREGGDTTWLRAG